MKKGVCICSIFLLLGSIFAEEPQSVVTQSSNVDLSLENENQKTFEKMQDCVFSTSPLNGQNYTISFIPYGQMLLVFPGYGATIRLSNQHFGFQIDGNMTHMNLGYFGRSKYLQISTSAVYYPFYFIGENSKVSRWNITCGIGCLHRFRFDTEIMLGPLSVGYQGEIFFFDAGISVYSWIDFPRFFGPLTKFGICF